MKLYYYPTPNSHKPCAVAKHLSLPVDYVRIDLAKGEQKRSDVLAVNPNGKVPALEDKGVRLWEANAIMAYLAHTAASDLWPSAPLEQIEVLKWLNWDTAHFSRHAGRLWFERFLKPRFGLGEPVQAEIDDAIGYFKPLAAVLNGELKGKSYLVGEHLTIADFAVAIFLPYAAEAALPLDGCDEIRRWHDGLLQIPAWAHPWPASEPLAA